MRRSFAVVLLLGFVDAAQAELITTPARFRSPSQVIDFSQFGGSFMDFSSQPIPIGGLVGEMVTASSTDTASVIGNDVYLLGTNGQWTAGRNGFVGLNSVDLMSGQLTGDLTFRFLGGPVAQVAALLNYLPDPQSPPVTIAALDGGGNVLELFDLTQLGGINTPAGIDTGAFFGISRQEADIAAFRVSNQFVVVDDLTFSRTTALQAGEVPEPSTLALVGVLGVSGMAVRWWRRRR